MAVHDARDVRVFPTPEPDFNPIEATDEELKHFGYFPRPDQRAAPRAFKYWMWLYSRRLHTVRPEFTELRGFHSSPPPTQEALEASGDDESWCGAFSLMGPNSTGDEPVGAVWGRWTIPNFVRPNWMSHWYTLAMATWVGVDGIGTPGLVQAGIAQTIKPEEFLGSWIGEQKQTFAWVEWWSDNVATSAKRINLDVAVGDFVVFGLDVTSPTTANVAFVNVTSGNQIVPFQVSAPNQESAVKGFTAEWIVENPVIEGVDPVYLPQFGQITISSCGLGTTDYNKILSLEDAEPRGDGPMTDPNGNIMAEAIVKQSTVEVFYRASE